jgi:hypothetical protein
VRGYFGTKISDHLVETRQDYLVCTDVPIARTGYQEYAPEELGLPAGNVLIKVYRDASQVFDPKTIASFEGNSITLYHPPQDLDASNDSAYNKGHIQNIREGKEPDAEGNRYLLADLIVKDASLIEQIKNKTLREVSCGYSYRLEPTSDGKDLQQVDIRGNHLAIVPRGRAGKEASIQDSAPEPRKRKAPMNILKHILGLGLKQYAQDAEPEQIADAMKECAVDEEPKKQDEPEKAADAVEPEEKAEKAEDEEKTEDPMTKVLDALKVIGDRVDKLENPEKAEEKTEDAEAEEKEEKAEDEDQDEEEMELEDAIPEPEEEKVEDEEEQEVEDEEIVIPAGEDAADEDKAAEDKKVGDALKLMRKVVAASGDRTAIDAFNSLLPKKSGSTPEDGYKLIATRKVADHSVQNDTTAAEDFLAKARAMHRKSK